MIVFVFGFVKESEEIKSKKIAKHCFGNKKKYKGLFKQLGRGKR